MARRQRLWLLPAAPLGEELVVLALLDAAAAVELRLLLLRLRLARPLLRPVVEAAGLRLELALLRELKVGAAAALLTERRLVDAAHVAAMAPPRAVEAAAVQPRRRLQPEPFLRPRARVVVAAALRQFLLLLRRRLAVDSVAAVRRPSEVASLETASG